MVSWLFALVVLALLGGAIYYGLRKQREHAERSARREAEMLALLRSATGAPASAEAPAAVPRPAKFLAGPAKAAYYLLKLGLPDHEIFSRVRLADLVDVGQTGPAATADFVVCTRDMEVAAVVLLDDDGMDALRRAVHERAAQALAAAGVRCVRLNGERLPGRNELRGAILGRAAQ